ncbi:MAG: hypothetical protein OQK48_08540 [Sulfurimonas sp.]|nr:hypothetical protein [Sulfurimonas sp.]
MKLWILATFYTASLLILSGCGAKATPKKKAVIDETLPIVKLTKNGTIVDTNAIALEWASINDQRVKGVYIYKAELNEDGGAAAKDEYYDTVDNRFSTHYLDKKIKPNTSYNYYFKTYSAGAESHKSETTLITSLPVMDSVTWIHSIAGMPRSAKVIWRPHTNNIVKSYIIQRRTLQDTKWKDIATVDGRLNAEYIDKGLKDKFTYKYRIRALTYDGMVSNPSEEVSVITKALPNELTQITATTNLPRKIKISWEKTDTQDFLNYNLYRASNVDGNYKLLLGLKGNSYVDVVEEDAKQYFYRVSVVDRDGLESKYDNYSVHGKTLVKPTTPSLVEARLINGQVRISWSNADPRVKSYIVQKRYKKSLFDEVIVDFENIKDVKFIDGEISPQSVYYYKVFSVDENDIKSQPSIEVKLKIGNIQLNKPEQTQTNFVDTNYNDNNEEEDVITPVQDFN